MDSPEEKNKNPLFFERGDGLGWTLNFDNKWSYLVLAAIFGVMIGVAILAIYSKK